MNYKGAMVHTLQASERVEDSTLCTRGFDLGEEIVGILNTIEDAAEL